MNNLITLYQEHLNLKNATFLRIEHEDAIVAIVYKVTQPDEKNFILKVCTRNKDYFNEIYFLKYFADKLPVPKIINIVEPKSDIYGAILMEYLPGTTLKISDLKDELAFQMGSLLAQIHQNKASGYDDLTEPYNLNSDPRFHFTNKFEEVFKECSNNLSKELLEKCKDYVDNHINLLKSVDGPCVTHRDFRPGNIIAHDGTIQGIIDWSAARASFAQEDFCKMEHGEWSINPRSKKPFLKGYESIRPIPDYESIMPLLRICKALDIIGFTVKRGTWNNSNSDLYTRNRKFLEEFF